MPIAKTACCTNVEISVSRFAGGGPCGAAAAGFSLASATSFSFSACACSFQSESMWISDIVFSLWVGFWD